MKGHTNMQNPFPQTLPCTPTSLQNLEARKLKLPGPVWVLPLFSKWLWAGGMGAPHGASEDQEGPEHQNDTILQLDFP